MAGKVAPNMVTNGLVLYLDAGNSRSYTSGSTVWNDLKDNNISGSLINGPTFIGANYGSILFDGVDDYVQQNTPLNTGQNVTVCSWIYRNNTLRGSVFSNSYSYVGSNGWYLISYLNSSLALAIGQDQSYIISQPNSIPVGVWTYVTGVIENGITSKLYKNGEELSLLTFGGSATTIVYNSGWKIGAFLGLVNDYYNGNVASTQIYNRVLSKTEIQQNYNATKKRYGL